MSIRTGAVVVGVWAVVCAGCGDDDGGGGGGTTDAAPTADAAGGGGIDASVGIDAASGVDASGIDAGAGDLAATVGEEAANAAAVVGDVEQALLLVVTDPAIADTEPRPSLTGLGCGAMPIGTCPSYGIACTEDAVTGLSIRYGGEGCDDCTKKGIPVSGTIEVARTGPGAYTLTFVDYRYGPVELDGTASLTLVRGESIAMTVTTPSGPLLIGVGEASSSATFELAIAELALTLAPTAGDGELVWSLALDATIGEQAGARTFAVQTVNDAGDDPLRSEAPIGTCFGPTAGSLRLTVDTGVLVLGIALEFTGASDVACAGVAVTPIVTPDDVDLAQAIADAVAGARAGIDRSFGDLPAGGLVGGAADAAGGTATRVLRALASTMDLGDLQTVMAEGWPSTVCDQTAMIPCASGTGSTTVACTVAVPSSVSATFDSCSIRGLTLDGAVTLSRGIDMRGGTASFAPLSIDATTVRGELTVTATTEGEDLEIDASSAPGAPLTVAAGGAPMCAYTLEVERVRALFSATNTEIELDVAKETASGRYEVATVGRVDTGQHLLWGRPLACQCPIDGSAADVSFPRDLQGEARQLGARISYGPPSSPACATVSVSITTWPLPDSTRANALKAALEGDLATALEALCTMP